MIKVMSGTVTDITFEKTAHFIIEASAVFVGYRGRVPVGGLVGPSIGA